jgi:hypothetical protein
VAGGSPDFRFAIANWLYYQPSIENRQLTIGNHETRYRVVVLTASTTGMACDSNSSANPNSSGLKVG